MKLPTWWSCTGLVEHLAVGLLVTAIAHAVDAPSWAPVVAMLGVGVLHEIHDGDLIDAPGAPLNGIVDVLAFLAAPVVWWILS